MQRQDKKSGLARRNHEILGRLPPELWHEYVIPHLDPPALVNASLSCRFFNQLTSDKLKQLQIKLGPRDYSQSFTDSLYANIDQMFHKDEFLHQLTLLNSNTFALAGFYKIYLIQFGPPENGCYEFTCYGEIPLLLYSRYSNKEKSLFKLSDNRIIISHDKNMYVYDWTTCTQLFHLKSNENIPFITITPDGYIVITLLEGEHYQLTYYDIDSNKKNNFSLFYQGKFHRIIIDTDGNFLVEGYILNHNHLYSYTPEGKLNFMKQFVHDDPSSTMDNFQHPTLFTFTNEIAKEVTIYKREKYYSPERVINFTYEGRYYAPAFLNNGFFAWTEELEESNQLKILDLKTKKIIHSSTTSLIYKYHWTDLCEMISLPNGDILSLELDHANYKLQLRTFSFPPGLKPGQNIQSSLTYDYDLEEADMEDTIAANLGLITTCSSCSIS